MIGESGVLMQSNNLASKVTQSSHAVAALVVHQIFAVNTGHATGPRHAMNLFHKVSVLLQKLRVVFAVTHVAS